MKRTVSIIIGILSCVNIFAQGSEKQAAFQLGLVPPLSTNGSQASQYTNRASVNLLVGVSRNETAFTMSGLTSVIGNQSRGFQMAGLNNLVGGSGSGFLMSGLVNNVRHEYRGFQMAGVLNTTGEYMNGFQMAGVLNTAGQMKGVQLGGLGNIAGDVSGFQMGGLFNVARDVHGVQFAALVNVARNSDYPVGIVNIIKNGEMGIGVSYNDAGSILLSFRSGGRVLYGILGAGYNHKAGDEKYVIEAGFGAHINISQRFRINNELKTAYMSKFKKDRVSQHTFAIMPAVRLIPQLEVFAGPSLNFMDSNNLNNTKLFPSHSLWKKYGEKNMRQLYVGFVVGTQFLF